MVVCACVCLRLGLVHVSVLHRNVRARVAGTLAELTRACPAEVKKPSEPG